MRAHQALGQSLSKYETLRRMVMFREIHISVRCLYIAGCIALTVMFGCGHAVTLPPESDLPTASKGYVLYVFARKTEVMVDFCKSDGLSRGTKLDVFRMDVPGMDRPVKIAEIAVEKVGKKMSKAKLTATTSSLQIERGDRVFPHPIIIVSDGSWLTFRNPVEGWKSEISLPDERDWEPCEVFPNEQMHMEPEMRQLVAETDARAIWHPSVKSHRGDVFFRRIFRMDADPIAASLSVVCGGKTNIYINDRWIGEAREWPEIRSFKVDAYLSSGKNLIAVHTVRDARATAPPVLLLALSIQTKFQ